MTELVRRLAAELQAAVLQHQRGNLSDARALYRRILKSAPAHPDALHLLGVVELQLGNRVRGRTLVRQALDFSPRHAMALYNLGKALAADGERSDAITYLQRLLAVDPAHVDAHVLIGQQLLHQDDMDGALKYLERAAQLRPDSATIAVELGIAYVRQGSLARALEVFDSVAGRDQTVAVAHFYCGIVHLKLRNPAKALLAFRKALHWKPDFAEAMNNLGAALLELKRPHEALEQIEASLSLQPTIPEALNNLCSAFRELQRHEAALDAVDKALKLRPDYSEALHNRAVVLRDLGRVSEAMQYANAAIELNPVLGVALNNIAELMTEQGDLRSAANHYENLVPLPSGNDYATGRLLHVRNLSCDWNNRPRAVDDVCSSVARHEKTILPFPFLAVSGDPQLQLRCCQTATNDLLQAALRETPRIASGRASTRISVAYISGDLREHAVSYLMAGIWEQHDRARFEITGVSLRAPDDSAMGKRVAGAFDRFVDISGQSDEEAANRLRAMDFDIAVDLTGHTQGFRPNLLARRIAPVQVSYLGFPGTSGADFIDFLLADEFVVPEDQRLNYSERMVYLPGCFQVNDARRPRIQQRVRRSYGLPEDAFVWCSFNRNFKITPRMFNVWMALLREVPASVLWLIADNPAVRSSLGREAERERVDPSRLVFCDNVSYEEHLSRLALADLYLDTYPFNGGTTISDALWARVPAITCAGRAFASRMAGSLLRNAGLGALVTESMEQYQSIALRLALSPEELICARNDLRHGLDASGLFDTGAGCRKLEAAYEVLAGLAADAELPAVIRVPHRQAGMPDIPR